MSHISRFSNNKKCNATFDEIRVYRRNCNYSYFESPKGGKHYSDYSSLVCLKCGHIWRSKASYIVHLADITDDEWNKIQS